MTINYTYTITTSNVASGTPIYWRVVSRTAGGGGTTGVVGDDFDTSSGNFTSNGTRTEVVSVGVKEQTGTEGTRNFQLQVSLSSGFSPRQSFDFQVEDGNAAGSPTYVIQGSDPLTVSEVASAQTITVNTTNVTNGTTLYWNITTDAPGSTQASTDWSAYNSGGTGFTINSNTGSFTIDALADATTETAETYYLHVRTGSDTGTSVDSIQLDITDDSQSAPTFSVSGVTGVSSIDDISGLPTVDQEMTEVIAVSNNSPFETTASFSLNSDGTVSYANQTQQSSGNNREAGTIITPSSAEGTFSNPGGSGQYSGPIDNWTSQTSASPGVGQFYQINIRAYNVGTTNILSPSLGRAIVTSGGNYSFLAGGDNNSSTWFRMNKQTSFTCFEETFTPSGTYNTDMDVEITIKEYNGTLGTGTTVFGPQTFTIRARNIV